MSKQKLEIAQQLIQEHNYGAARAVLATIQDHPTAQKWLLKLDQLAPARQAEKKPNRWKWVALVEGVLLLLLIAFGIVALPTIIGGQTAATNSLERMTESYCRWSAPGGTTDIDAYCKAQVPVMLTEDADKIQTCYMRSDEGRRQETFIRCMMLGGFSISIGSSTNSE